MPPGGSRAVNLLATPAGGPNIESIKMKPTRFPLVVAALLCWPCILLAAPAASTVQMITPDGTLQPSTTLEFRFPAPMVAPADLGPASETPVVFTPDLPGTFTWLSTRSGVFSPQGPLPLGAAWEVRLRPGLKDASGKPPGGDFAAKLSTPPFGVTAAEDGVWNNEDVPTNVGVKLAFQSAVAPEARFFQFVDSGGRKVDASVRHLTDNDYFEVAPEAADWDLRWRLSRDPSAKADGEDEFAARLVVTPATPLPAGSGWKLVINSGFPSASGAAKLNAPYEVPLGTVQPFDVRKLEAANYINSGTALSIEFNSSLAPDIDAGNASKFFTITPEPPGLAWEIEYDTAIARGKFELGRDYRLVIGPDMCSSVGQPFGGARERDVRFGPVPPRLYLPELTTAQILGGRRLLPVRSINLESLRVKAVLLAPDTAARAMSAFNEHQWKYNDGEPMPVTDLAGRVLCDETIKLPGAAIDVRQTTDLDWTRVLGGKKAGVILLEVQGKPLPGTASQPPAAQALIQLTDLGILWKKAGATIRTHVFSTATARPIAGASARLLDDKFQPVAMGRTGTGGDAALEYTAVPRWLVVEATGDTCIIPMGQGANPLRIGEWYSSDWSPAAEAQAMERVMVFTDRPVYKPGETAHFKGFVRRIGPEGMEFVPGETVTLVLRNPEFAEVSRFTATTDDQGAFDASLPVPASPLGNYTLQVEGRIASASFVVAEYQPDAFEVNIDMPAQFPAGASAPHAMIGGQYFFGGKITDADVRWTLRYFSTPFTPEGFDGFQFTADEDDNNEAKPLTLRGDGRITGGQPLSIAPILPTPELGPSRGVLTAEVTDINQQTVSRKAEFTREASDFYLGIVRPEENVVRKGDEVTVQIVAVRPDAQPLDKPVEVSVSIKHLRYNVVRVLGAGGAMTFRRDIVEEPLTEQKAMTVVPVRGADGWSAGDATSMKFKTAKVGRHQVRVTTRDSAGREVASESSFYVSGEGETVWDYRNPAEITLVPDKTSYLPGDTARVLVQTPIAGEAFVSIERGSSILRSMRIPLDGNAPAIEIPLGKEDAPNVTVSLVILRGADASPRKFPAPEFRYGSCTLAIEQLSARLRVAVSPEKTSVQPGEEIATTVTVTDHLGKPVAGAGVTFYAVDEGVLALTGFERPDPAKVFLAPVATRVLTGLSLTDLLPEDPADLQFSNKGYLIGGGGEGGPMALRENFPGTACWLPSLVTDKDGRVTARFKAPDALTRYRLVAVAVSGPDAFGSAESAVGIVRPLMILPALGQFANAGDRLVARAVVRNETGKDGKVDVTLKTPAAEEKVTLDIPQGASKAAEFPLGFKDPGTVDLEWSATMQADGKTFADRVKTVLPVGSPMVQLRETYFAELKQPSNNLLEGINPQLAEGRGDVAVTVANTRLSALGDKARFLAEYPYGCVEQTTSSFVPWLVMPVLGPLMPDFAKDPEEVKRVTSETVAKLLDFQTSDGGLSFWPGGATSAVFPSAWAAIVLARASDQGAKLPPRWGKLLDYLAKSLRGLEPGEDPAKLADRTFAAYALALAGRAESSYHEELYRRRADLPAEARCVLALAIMEAKGPAKMVSALLRDDKSAPGDISPFGGETRDRAIRLLAWTAYEPSNKEVSTLLAEVLALGPQNAHATTQNSAWTLLALADYYTRVEQKDRGRRDVAGTVVAGQDTVPFTVDAKRPAVRQTFQITPGPESNVLKVENPAAAPLYGETRFTVYPPLGEQPPQDRGFSVSRSYRKIGPDGTLMPADNLRVGDRVVVTLRLETSRPAHFVAIDDPLPSILEAVNPDFVSREVGGASEDATTWFTSHRETRADRVLYFCDALPPGAFTFQYLARVRVAGEAAAGATKAEAMYRPERFGLGMISRLSSKPAQTP